MLHSLVYLVEVFHQREILENLQKVRNVRRLFCYPKTGGCALQFKAARDQENIFHFEFCVNKYNYFFILLRTSS